MNNLTTEDLISLKREGPVFLNTIHTGLGDDVEKLAKIMGAAKFMRLWEYYTNSQCNCPKRKEILNKYPSVIEKIKSWSKTENTDN